MKKYCKYCVKCCKETTFKIGKKFSVSHTARQSSSLKNEYDNCMVCGWSERPKLIKEGRKGGKIVMNFNKLTTK